MWSEIYGYIEDGSADDGDELGLGSGILEMEAADGAWFGVGQVHFCPGVGVAGGGVEALCEKGSE